MAKIDKSIDFILANEGGFTNDAADRGGPTNWGIIAVDVARFRGVPVSQITIHDMKILSKTEAIAIYKKQYWDALKLDGVVSQPIATAIFDIGVVRGISIGAKYAQKACTLLGHPLAVDGQVGPLTLLAINKCEVGMFIHRLEALFFAGFVAIVEHNPSQHVFLKGWERRAERLLTLIPV